MAQRDTYHTVNSSQNINEQRQRSEIGQRVLDYTTLAGLVILGILLAGLVSTFLFGSSVTTAL